MFSHVHWPFKSIMLNFPLGCGFEFFFPYIFLVWLLVTFRFVRFVFPDAPWAVRSWRITIVSDTSAKGLKTRALTTEFLFCTTRKFFGVISPLSLERLFTMCACLCKLRYKNGYCILTLALGYNCIFLIPAKRFHILMGSKITLEKVTEQQPR